MGIADKLGAKTKGLGEGASLPPATSPETGALHARGPRTGPGQLLAVRSMMGDANAELEKLRERLQAFDGSVPARQLDPNEVAASKFANRHQDEFKSDEFEQLRDDIRKTGRNVQPISVRPVHGRAEHKFEVIYGHRRLQACKDLGLKVWAIVVEATDEELFIAMDTENRQRKNPSPFELGDSYRRALEHGLFVSMRELAARLNVDLGLVSKAVVIANLPAEVLAAFPSPTAIQYRWGKSLSDAIQKDPEGVIRRAKKIKQEAALSAAEVLTKLLQSGEASQEPAVRKIAVTGQAKPVGKLSRSASGAISLSLSAGMVSAASFERLHEFVVGLVAESGAEPKA